jgi:ribosomal protein S27E
MSTAATPPHRFPCAGCGADLEFSPGSGSLACPYCGRTEAIPQSAQEVVEKSYEEYLKIRPEHLGGLAEGALEVKCDGCGGTITFTPPEVSTKCPFCGRNRVEQPKSADPIVAPQGLLPFALTGEAARGAVRSWLASRWFAPSALKSMAQQQGIAGVYLPFWTYDAGTTTFYQGERGTYYYVSETYVENGQERTREVRRTQWQGVSGRVDLWHENVLVPATQAVSPERLKALAPWDLARLAGYDPKYLAGFAAQRYQLDVSGGFEEAKGFMGEAIKDAVRSDIGGDEQRVEGLTTSYSAVTFKHILLPVYVGAYSFGSKVYQIMVNARTGEVQGDRPYSILKIAGAVAVAVLLLFLLIWLQQR